MTNDFKATDAPKHVMIAGCGYLGLRAAELWLANGAKVCVLTRSESKAAQLAAEGFTPLKADLADGVLPKLPAVDTVLWSVGFDRTARHSREAIWIDGLTFLLKNLPPTVNRLLYVSSTGVYAQTDGAEVSESSAAEPVTESGLCCLQAEQLVRQHASTTEMDATVLRMAGLYGPNRLLRRTTDLRAGTPMKGSPDNFLNLIHIDDAVRAAVHVTGHRGIPLTNVVNTQTLTRAEYYSELAQLVDAPVPVFDQTQSTARGSNKRVVSNVAAEIGIKYQFNDVRHGLRDAIERTSNL